MGARQPGRRRVRRAWLVLAALLSLLVSAEVLARAVLLEDGMWQGWRPLPPFGALTNPGQRGWLEGKLAELEGGAPEERLVRFDAELGWVVRPSWTAPDGSVRTSSIGTRGAREYAEAPPPGATRVVAFGDSYTWCDEVADDETWEHAIERDHPDWEVLNLGVGGYGTDQALLRFRREGRRGAGIVLIGLQIENLGRNVGRYRPLYYPNANACAAKPRFVRGAGGGLELVPLPFATEAELVRAVADGSVLGRLREHEHWADPTPSWLGVSALARIAAGRFAYAARDVERLCTETGAEPFLVTLDLVETFHREALAAGATAAPVVLFMSGDQIRPYADGGPRFWAELARAIEARGIPCLDLGDTLRDGWLGGRDPDYFRRAHLGPPANERVARAIHAELEELLEPPLAERATRVAADGAAHLGSWGNGAPGLRLDLPPGYEATSESTAEDFVVYYVTRPGGDASLGIYVGMPPSSFAPADAERGPELEGTGARWSRWEHVDEDGRRWHASEVVLEGWFADGAGGAAPDELVLHLFVTGSDPAEVEALRRAAATLRLDR